MERYYFVVQNDQQSGPFTYEQLKVMPLTHQTKIWYQGLDGWKTIGELPELSELIALLPPPVGNSQWQSIGGAYSGTEKPDPPKTYLTEAILVTIFCCQILGIVSIVYASQVEGKYDRGDYEGAEKTSDQAKQFMQYGFWSGLVLQVIMFLFIIAGAGGGRSF